MTRAILRLLMIGSVLCTVPACSLFPASSTLQGYAIEQQPLANGLVQIRDANGQVRTTTTRTDGFYRISSAQLTAPLLLSVSAQGNAEACHRNDQLRPICLASVVMELEQTTQGNINPLTDRVTSDIAVALGHIGPQQWVNQQGGVSVPTGAYQQALENLHSGFADALTQIGIDTTSFDATRFPMERNSQLADLLSLLHHNRNYDNNTGETGHATLSDFSFRPIVGLSATGAYERFDIVRARAERNALAKARTRIFIVGDSTSAVYEQLRFPRMGWGQVFEQEFTANSGIKVVTGSRAGRSSRDFYNGRWFAQMESLIQPGDYVFINHGHNDQNCDSNKPVRGMADVRNLCTYPNSDKGDPQFPANQPELSFQYSLERYIEIARSKGAIPVMFTPTARIKNARGEQTTPVVHTHLIRAASGKHYLFTGDYTQTIKDVARKHQLPLIDLEARSIEFANRVGNPGWKDYWLVVDPAINPFYANNVSGSPQAPDGTHFQQRGAEAMAKLVAEEIRKQPALTALAKHVKGDR